MALGNLAVYSLLHPGNFIHQRVAILVHEIDCKTILCIYHPDEKKAVFLDLVERNVQDLFVTQGVVCDGNTSRWVRVRQCPRWIAGYHIEQPSSVFLLLRSQIVPIEFYY